MAYQNSAAKEASGILTRNSAGVRILEPLDLRAAVAVVLAYFAALRPAEIRGLQWADYDGAELNIRRGVWRNVVGETKTEDSAHQPWRALFGDRSQF
jgi:integrase